MCANFAVILQTAKVMATCLVSAWLKEKVLNLYGKIFSERERDRIRITFIIMCSYNCCNLLLFIVNLLLCLIEKLNFILGKYVPEKKQYTQGLVLGRISGTRGRWAGGMCVSWNVFPVGQGGHCS